MPFGLKNVGSTYQRLINKLFAKQLGQNVEAYIDDMIVRSEMDEEYLTDLKETVESLRIYKMKLNPKKCTFGVRAGKYLGFMVLQRGIEANPDKVKAV